MKKETTQKSKLWIWIAIAAVALLAAVGVVLALVLGGGEEPPAVDGPQGGRAELYFNIDRDEFTATSTTGLSTREPDASGKYVIRFAHDGELLELTVLDKKLVNRIDTQDVMGLVFDENGVVIDQINVRDLATEFARRVFVRTVKDGVITANSSLAMNGMELNISLSDVSVAYDVRVNSENLGKVIDPSEIETMDCISVYANDLGENTHIYLMARQPRSKVYWNATQMYNSSAATTTRVPDENGVYTIDMYCDGELLTLKCKDVDVLTSIDRRGNHNAYVCLRFDEEGYITGVIETPQGLPGMLPAYSMDVETVENGRTITVKNRWNALYNTKSAESWSGTLPEDCPIYDVSSAALAEGRRGKPVDEVKVGDRITVWTDMDGKPILAYISMRMVEGLKPTMLMSRSYNSTTRQTTRTPDADGYYNLEFIINGGGTKVYKTKDKQVASFIDSYAERCFGLVTRGDVIVRAYDYECIFGFTRFCTALYADTITGSILSASDGPQTATYNIVLAEDYEVYDISGYGEYGARTTLKEGDVMIAFRNRFNEVCTVYVIRRYVPSGSIYYNTQKLYNATTKETTRVPDAEGWYVFNMVKDGKQTTVKTKDKALASKMENMTTQVMGLQVKGDVVQTAFPAEFVTGGWRITAGAVINAFPGGGDIEYHIYGNTKTTYKAVARTGFESYNISLAYTNFQGEASRPKVGDNTLLISDRTGKVAVIFVRMRKIQTGIYWNVNSMYDATEATYARQPDEEGWYKLQVIRNGKIETVKTKDRTMARKIDSYVNGGFTLLLKGDEVLSVASYDYATDAHSTKFGRYDVESINGNEVTVKFNRPAAAYFGTTGKFNLGNAKVYNVSPNAGEAFGQLTTLQVGDRVVVYANEDGQATNIFVTFRNGVKTAYCSHCDKEVVWNPWAGGAFEGETGHHYVYDNCTVYTQSYISGSSSNYEVVLDLNGKTVTRETTGRVFVVDTGETMTILDSVGGGVVQAVGNTGNYTSVALVTGKGTMNLLSGTFKMLESADKAPSRGGVVYVYGADATFNMKGGEIIGGKVVPSEKLDISYAGAVYLLESATFNMSGGKITGGTAQFGGAVAAFNKSNFTMTGGTITGGTGAADANFGGYGYGGNVYVREGSTFTMTGGTITGGTAERGGNVFAGPRSKFVLSGGTIEGGSAPRGGNVYIDNAEVTVTGGTITGGKATLVAGNVMLVSNGKLNLLGGSITNGVVDATGSKYASGGNIYAWGGNSEINVAGGTVSGGVVKGGSETNNGGNICLDKDSEKVPNPSILNLTKGSIEGGNAPSNGGNVNVAAGTIANIMGGTVKGGTAGVYGGNIFVMGTLNVKDGEILNGRATNCGGNIYCCGGTSTISGGKIANGGAAEDLRGGNIGVRTAATLNMTGGTVENGKASKLGGNINIEGTFNMSGGQILGGQVLAANQSGGSIALINNGVANISGGTIDGYLDADQDNEQDVNATRFGGLIFIWADPNYSTELNISGDALLKNGKAASSGDMIFVTASQGTTKVNISGGTLSGAASNLGGGIVNITGGTYDGGLNIGAAVDLTIGKTAKITATNGGLNLLANAKMKLDALEEGADIFVTSTALKAPISVANENAGAYAEFFNTGSEDKVIQELEGVLYIVNPSDPVVPGQPSQPGQPDPDQPDPDQPGNTGFDRATFVCPHCDKTFDEINWVTTFGGGFADNTHYYLANGTNDTNIGGSFGSGRTFVVVLDNYTLHKSDAGRAFSVTGGSMYLLGYNGSAITASGNAGAGGLGMTSGGTLYLGGNDLTLQVTGTAVPTNGGLIRMYNGTVILDGATLVAPATLAADTNYGGIINMEQAGATFIMKSGTLDARNLTAAGNGGAIGAQNGTINIEGGTIYGVPGKTNGGAIYQAAGTLNISGGTIDGGINTAAAVNVTVSKNAKVTATNGGLNVLADALINLGSLESGAEVYVTTANINTAFTVANDKAPGYAAYFKSTGENKKVQAYNDKLYVIDTTSDLRDRPCPCSVHNGAVPARSEWAVGWAGVSSQFSNFNDGLHWYVDTSLTPGAVFGISGDKEAVIAIPKDVTFGNKNAGRTLVISVGATLHLVGDGVVTGQGSASASDAGGLIRVLSDGKLYIHNNIQILRHPTSTNTAGAGGLIAAQAGGQVVMNGGLLSAPATSGNGGAVAVQNANASYGPTKFIMNAGVIDARNSTATSGGAIWNNGGEVTIQGSARIMGTTANITNGGIIGAHQSEVPAGHATVVNILGNALLTGGKATNGDGIKMFAGTLNIGQNAVLRDVNGTVAIDLTAGTTTISGGTVAGGIKLASGVDFTVSGAAKVSALNGGVNVLENALIKLGEMDGAEVFVTATPNTVFTNTNANAAALANTAIKSAVADTVVEATDNTLKIVAAPAQG